MVESVALRRLLLAAGIAAVALGVAGIFLPLLPTTPFLLLAAACFIRSSDRHYQWLVDHPRLGPHIRNYREHKATTMRVKIVTLALLWASIGYAAVVVVGGWTPRAVLVAVAAGVTAHVLSLKVVR
jgi:uncharacterized membrane protein YbaN (DUF454 family)